MFFFIGLTMATIQGTYARRISPGGEVTAVKRVGLPLWWATGGAPGRARHELGTEAAVPAVPPQAMLLLVPAFLLIGWGHSLPVLGLGLLLYSFGEYFSGGRGRQPPLS